MSDYGGAFFEECWTLIYRDDQGGIVTNVADEAKDAVLGARMDDYGPPALNHGCTAEMWSAYIARRFGIRVELTAEDVCWLNVLQKVSREANRPKRDNSVDAIGYVLNVELIREAA